MKLQGRPFRSTTSSEISSQQVSVLSSTSHIDELLMTTTLGTMDQPLFPRMVPLHHPLSDLKQTTV